MTNMQSASGQIIKTDSLARVRTPPERKRELLEEFERSGLSAWKFATLVGIKYQTFAAWVAKRKREGRGEAPAKAEAGSAAKVRWLKVVLDQAQVPRSDGSILTLQFAGGAWAEVGDGKQIQLAAALLRALDKTSAGC
jgi:transposase-like protein